LLLRKISLFQIQIVFSNGVIRYFLKREKNLRGKNQAIISLPEKNDVAIAHIGLGKYVVSGEAETAVIGAGGVVVRRECQGQGIPSLLFDVLHTTTTLNARNSATALFCPRRLVSYYERFGYREYKAGVRFLQNSRYIETPLFCFMVRGLSGLRGQLEIPSGPW
jgi:GNAT superfamily N-acetyltransferase